MKLKTLIQRLEKERLKFIEKEGREPLIFDLSLSASDDLEVRLTSKVVGNGFARYADCKRFKVKLPFQ